MVGAKRNSVGYCNAFISHCANYYFQNENLVDLALLTEAQANNFKCVSAALSHFNRLEVDMLRCVFTSGLPLAEAMSVLYKNSESSWFVVRKFIKLAASYRGLI